MVLNSQPTGDVTVNIAISGTAGVVSLDTASLTFTSTTWNNAKTVTVTGVNDDVDSDRTTTISHTVSASGTDYAGVSVASVSVTLTDDDTKGVGLSETGLTVTEAAGETHTATYTVVLDSQPSGNVTVNIASGTAGVVLIDSASLTFTSSTWNNAKTVTVTGVDDKIDSDRTTTISHTISASGTDYETGVTVAGVSVTLTDDDTKGVGLSETGLTVTEAAGDTHTGTYTVVLDSQPSGNVTVNIASGTAGVVLIDSASLTFTSTTWNNAKTVTVTGVNDDIDNDPDRTTTISHTISATGTDYETGVAVAGVSVTLTDDDTKGVGLSETGLTVTEAAGDTHTGTYTVVLDSQPSGNVTVNIASGTAGVVLIDSASLTFTSTTWNNAKTVTVTGVNDDIDNDPDRTTTISHTISASGTDYETGVAVAGVSVTLTDDDTKGVGLSETGLTVTEAAGDTHTGTYTVVLDSQPSGDVTVNIAISGTAGVVLIDTASLTFTSSTWNNAKTVTVTGVNDDIDNDPDRTTTISHTLSATGTDYETGVTVAGVSVTLTDDDTKGVSISETDLTVTEAAGDTHTGTYTVVLDSQPSGNVTVNIASGTAGVVLIDTASLTFTSSTWNNAKTVTVTGVDDKIDSDRTTTISHTLSATGTDYETGVTVAGVSVTLTDDDTKGVSISETDLTVTEAAGDTHTGTYTVVLDSQPSGNVTVNIASGTAGVVSLDTSSLTFTSTTWNNAKTVTVTGVDDKIDSDRTTTISHTVSASGTDYAGVTVAGVSVTLTDDDTKGITVLTSTPLTIAEDAGEATYTLVLNSQPTGDVTVNIASGTAGVVSLDTSSLTFNSTTWSSAKTVTVTGVNDDIDSDRTTTISHTVSATGTDYEGVSVAGVSVTLTDDDTKGVGLSETDLTVTEAAGDTHTGTYTVVLDSQPSGNVTVNIASGTAGVVLIDSASLTFTSTTWNNAKTVTVTGVNDDIDNDPDRTTTISHTISASGTDYETGVTVAGVSVTLTDDDTKGVGLSETGLTVTEAAGDTHTGTYTVVLDSQPSGNVTVNIASGTAGVVLIDSASLTFTSSTWNNAKTVTVTGVNDDIDNDPDRTTTISHTISASGTDYETGVAVAGVSVTLTDDDTKGVGLSETGLTVTEAAGDTHTGTYTVVLDSKPSGDVTVNIAISGTAGVVLIDTASLTFTSSTWNNAKTVTVTGVNDDIDNDPDRTTTISHTLSATGTDYETGVTVAGVSVTLTDDDTKGVSISETDLTVTEAAGDTHTGTYTVVLDSQPSGNVTVNIASGTAGVVSLDTSSLTFTSTTWNNAKTVTVTGVNDDIDNDPDRTTTISHTISASGTDYETGVTVAGVSVTLTDDDTKGVGLSETGLTVTEAAGDTHTGTYTVVLDSQPSGNVTVNIASGTAGVVLIDSASLTFTSSTWNNAKTVTVTGVNDDIDNDPDRTTTISHTISASGTDYETGVAVAGVSVTLTDDDTKGVGLSETGLTVTEAAGDTHTGTYTVVLDSKPSGDVTVNIAISGTAGVVLIDTASLTFTSSTWNNAKTVTVTGVNDDIDNDPDRTTTISHTVSASGTDYAGVSVAGVAVTLTDDETKGVGLSTSTLTVGENAQTGSYTVVLNSKPTGTGMVTVNISSGNTNVATVDQASLSFSTSDWNTPKTARVTTVDDNVVNDPARTATISHTVSGPGTDYASGVSSVDMTLVATDNDQLTVVITGPSGPLNGNIDLTITFSSAVSNFVKGDITVSSGTLGSLSAGSNGVFTITLTPASNTDASVTVDIAANMATAVATSIGNIAAAQYSVEVDNVRPGILGQHIGVPGDGTYETGGNLDFTVEFTEDVFVVGAPYLSIYIGSGTYLFVSNNYPSYLSGSGGRTLTFRYTVSVGDTDADGITMSNRWIGANSGDSIRDIAGNLILINGSNNKFTMTDRHLIGVIVDTLLRNDLVLQDRVVSNLPGEQIPALPFDPGRIKGLTRWLDGGDPKTLFSDLSCTTPLGRGESSLGCWSDKSGRGEHYLPVLSMDWPTLSDLLVVQEGREFGELFVVTDREGKVDILSFVYPYSLSVEEFSHDFGELGELREVVIYEEWPEESERAELERYLSCRWQGPRVREECLSKENH